MFTQLTFLCREKCLLPPHIHGTVQEEGMVVGTGRRSAYLAQKQIFRVATVTSDPHTSHVRLG